jgi:hypothetical protein
MTASGINKKKYRFFMDKPLQEIIYQQCKGELKLNLMKHKLEIVHHNVQSLINKHLELNILLSTSFSKCGRLLLH